MCHTLCMAARRIPITGSVLAWAMAEASVTAREVADHLNVPEATVRAWQDERAMPNKGQLDKLARFLARPASFFFLARPPESKFPTALLRRASGSDKDWRAPSRRDRAAIRSAQNAQEVSRWVAGQTKRSAIDLPSAALTDAPDDFAGRLRSWLGWRTSEQIELRDDEVARALRAHIEEHGILTVNFTLADERYRGFCLPDPVSPLIAINTRDDVRARSLSYVHELAHLCLGVESLCTDEADSRTERWCERVAGCFLLPDAELRRFVADVLGVGTVREVDDVRRLADHFNISNRAAAVRLSQVGLAGSRLYSIVNAQTAAKSRKSERNGVVQTRARRRLQRYGRTYVTQLLSAAESGALSDLDVLEYLNVSRRELAEVRAIAFDKADL